MAIVIEQRSKCPLCDLILDQTKKFILVPPITSNTKDPLFLFSDSGVHLECLNKNSIKNKLLFHIQCYEEHIPPSVLKCVVDGQRIDNPEDILFYGLLTSDETEELYRFNYLTINLKNKKNWDEHDRFLHIAKKFLSEEKWIGLNDFNKLEYIVNKLEE